MAVENLLFLAKIHPPFTEKINRKVRISAS